MRQYVAAILVKPDGSVLAQHRDEKVEITGSGTWGTVGGAFEPEVDDSLRATAVRELREETSYIANLADLQLLTEDEYTSERGVQIHRTIFWAKYDGVQKVDCLEGQEMRFVTREELLTLNIYTGHERFLREASETVFRSGRERKS